jgi:hypothetical protein
LIDLQDSCVFNNLNNPGQEKRINELMVPLLLIWKPKILRGSRVTKPLRLNDEVNVDVHPGITPG